VGVSFEPNIEEEIIADREFVRAREFVDTIGLVSEIAPNEIRLDLGEVNPMKDAISRYQTYEHRGHPTLFLANAMQLGQANPGEGLAFTPRISRGGKRSFHGVFFGDFDIGSELSIPVAVKPHVDQPSESCLKDYLSNGAVKRIGLHTLRNVGYVMSETRAYSMTVLDDTLDTFDSLDWSGFLPNIYENPGMQDMWRELAGQTAFLHAKGSMSHGDLAGRNVAIGSEGSAFVIDWEKARLSFVPPRDVEAQFSNSYLDLSVLLESMCLPPHAEFKAGLGIFYGKTQDWWQGFQDIFFDEYKEVRIMEATTRTSYNRRFSRKKLLGDVKEELSELERTLRSDIVMYQEICENI